MEKDSCILPILYKPLGRRIPPSWEKNQYTVLWEFLTPLLVTQEETAIHPVLELAALERIVNSSDKANPSKRFILYPDLFRREAYELYKNNAPLVLLGFPGKKALLIQRDSLLSIPLYTPESLVYHRRGIHLETGGESFPFGILLIDLSTPQAGIPLSRLIAKTGNSFPTCGFQLKPLEEWFDEILQTPQQRDHRGLENLWEGFGRLEDKLSPPLLPLPHSPEIRKSHLPPHWNRKEESPEEDTNTDIQPYSLLCDMPGEVVMEGENFSVTFLKGNLAGLFLRDKTPYTPSEARHRIKLFNHNFYFESQNPLALEGDGFRGLKDIRTFNEAFLNRAGKISLDYLFHQDSPWLGIFGRVEYPVFKEDTLIEEFSPLELPLFSLEQGRILLSGLYPEGSYYRATIEEGFETTLAGRSFTFQQNNKTFILALGGRREDKIHLLPLREEKIQGSSILWANPFGNYSPFLMKKGDLLTEEFRLFINLFQGEPSESPYPPPELLSLLPNSSIILFKT